MGMFDEVILDYDKKGLSKYKNIIFQTKSFDWPVMDKYKIDQSGQLLFGVKGQKRLSRKQEIETFKMSLHSYRSSVKNPDRNSNFLLSFFHPKDKYYKTIIRKWSHLNHTMTLEIYTYINSIDNKQTYSFNEPADFVTIYLYLYNGKVKKTKINIEKYTGRI